MTLSQSECLVDFHENIALRSAVHEANICGDWTGHHGNDRIAILSDIRRPIDFFLELRTRITRCLEVALLISKSARPSQSCLQSSNLGTLSA